MSTQNLIHSHKPGYTATCAACRMGLDAERSEGSGVAAPGKCEPYLQPTGCNPTGDDHRWTKGALVNSVRRREPAGETGLPSLVSACDGPTGPCVLPLGHAGDHQRKYDAGDFYDTPGRVEFGD